MASKSIGSLFVDIEARTAKLEQDMGKVKTILDNGTASVNRQGEAYTALSKTTEKNLLNLTQRLAGMVALFTFFKNELIHVSRNINAIPGVPEATIQSIETMNYSLSLSKTKLDQMVAGLVAGFANFGTGIGIGFGEMIYGSEAAEEGLRRLNEEAKEFENRDYVKRLADLNSELAKLQAPRGNRAEMLLAEAAALKEKSKTLGTLKERQDAEIESVKKTIEYQRERNLLQNKYLEAVERWQVVNEKEEGVFDSRRQRIASLTSSADALQRRIGELHAQVSQRQPATMKDGIMTQAAGFDPKLFTAKEMEELTKLYEKLSRVDRERIDLLRKQGELFREMGRAIADNLGDAILKGASLKELVKSLAGDLFKIVLTRTITGPLGDMLGGGLASLFGGKASGGPIKGAHVVGEFGPELFIPNGGGTIIPNDKLRGGGGGNQYIIDARGVDESVIGRLEQTLFALAGPGVVERRAIGATSNHQRRTR